MILRTLLLTVFLVGSPLIAEDRVLFRFDNAEAAKQWQPINDGVMGGRSDGRFKINDEKNMEFFGTLFPNEKFDPSDITGMGIQLSDNKPGPFKLEVEWIKASKTLGE